MSTGLIEMTEVEAGLYLHFSPPVYYSVSNPHDPAAVRGARARREDFRMWQNELPSADADLRLTLARLRRSSGHGDGYSTSAIFAHHRLEELPRLKLLQRRLVHLDLHRLKAIDGVLNKIAASVTAPMAVIDEELTDFLTPTRANQNLPTPGEIRKKLNAIIQTLDTSVSEKDDPLPDPRDHFEVGFEGDRAYITVETDAATGLEIDIRVRKHAAANNMSLVDAYNDLMRGEGNTSVTLNIYRAHDVEDAPGWMSDVGYINPTFTDELAAKATRIRDMDELKDKMVKGYATPEDIKAVIIGFDGGCSEADCSCPGHRTQMEHRVNHADGGPTTAANMAAFCPTHHNVKTDGRMTYIIDPHTREKYLLYEDGTYVISEPRGPLSLKERRWLQTVGQRMHNRRERVRKESQDRRNLEKRAGLSTPPPTEDDPPPF